MKTSLRTCGDTLADHIRAGGFGLYYMLHLLKINSFMKKMYL